jgi:hypothetical protein
MATKMDRQEMDSPEKSEIREIKDAELDQVAGAFGMLSSAFSNAIKSIGEGLTTLARKQ